MKYRTILAFAFAALSPQTLLAEIALTDMDGRQITLEQPPERVALAFYFEDYLAVTGPEGMDKVVAISRAPWADWRPGQWQTYLTHYPQLEKLPDIGHAEDNTMSAEAIISARPDVAIMSTWQTAAIGEPGVKQLEEAGIKVIALDYNAQTVETHARSTEILGAVMGQTERAEELAQNYRDKIDDTLARVAAAAPSKRKIYVELAQSGPGEIGNSYGKGMWAGVINMVGGQNIATGQIENWGPLSPEYVIAQQPDVILLAGSEWRNKPESVQMGFGASDEVTQPRLAAYARRPGWENLPAVKDGQVYGIYHGGTRTLSDYVYVRAVAKMLYPEAFADVDPAAELSAYYDKWMPVKTEGGLFVAQMK